jgi:hypothetical protein
VFVESSDDEQIIQRVAGLDIGKAEIVCCVRLPAAVGGGRRVQEVSAHSRSPPAHRLRGTSDLHVLVRSEFGVHRFQDLTIVADLSNYFG